jgi:hypothetical protein
VTGTLDGAAGTRAEDALTRALATFAVARALNGAISVAQGTEVALEPGGVGVILTPGQVLDPVNDLIERFSSVMLFAASSLGLQIVLLDVLSWPVLTVILVLSSAIWVALLWWGRESNRRLLHYASRIVLALLVVRFAIPIVIIGTDAFFDGFLLSTHDSATQVLESSTATIRNTSSEIESGVRNEQKLHAATIEQQAVENGNWSIENISEWTSELRESVMEWVSSAGQFFESASLTSAIDSLKNSAAEITSHVVDLIVVFVLQTAILPIVFLWFFVEIIKRLAGRAIDYATDPAKSEGS